MESNKNVRETPRGKAQDYKLVKVAKDVGQTRFEKDFQLYDLSQGGMGFFARTRFF
jgi:c-di-GMP-binding flagellar brake protein YcgR